MSVTNDDRVEYAVQRLTRWIDNLEHNASNSRDEGYRNALTARVADFKSARDLLDGSEDDHIRWLKNQTEEKA